MFALNEEQRLIDDAIERALKDHAEKGDSNSDSWPVLAQLGLLGIGIDDELGGAGGGPVELMMMARHLGRHLVSSAFLGTQVVGRHLVQQAANGSADALARTVLNEMQTGEHRLALAVFEQSSRYGLNDLATHATAQADGSVVLNGTKHYVLDGAVANTLIVASGSGEAIGVYAVPTDSPGVRVVSYNSVDGTSLATVHLSDVSVPATAQLHAPARGRAVLEQALALGAFAVAADILGSCEVALDKTVEYLKVREQFGTRLSRFQALQHRAADLHAEIEMLRSLVLGAAQTLSVNVNSAAMADAHAALIMAVDVGDHVGREAIQMHGAVGMTRDLGVGRYLMRANTLSRLFGDSDQSREDYLRLTVTV